jgi:hypothetical protein
MLLGQRGDVSQQRRFLGTWSCPILKSRAWQLNKHTGASHRDATPRQELHRIALLRDSQAFFANNSLSASTSSSRSGAQPFEPGVLFFEFFQTLGLVDGHASVGFAPAVKRVLGDAVFAADSSDGLLTFLRLLQDLDDLLGRMVIGFHIVLH